VKSFSIECIRPMHTECRSCERSTRIILGSINFLLGALRLLRLNELVNALGGHVV
jgi:hypothetical protein